MFFSLKLEMFYVLYLTLTDSTHEIYSSTVLLPGSLSAVGDLRASSNASSVTISWTAPFSLDVTGVDPDIWYSVLIYNVTDENNPTAILCTDCINITETHYTFTPDYLSPCHVYNFSVIPVNGAGQGESSTSIAIGMSTKCNQKCTKCNQKCLVPCVYTIYSYRKTCFDQKSYKSCL